MIEAEDFLVSERSTDSASYFRRKQPGTVEPGSGPSAAQIRSFSAPRRKVARKGPCRRNRSPDCVRGDRGTAQNPRARSGILGAACASSEAYVLIRAMVVIVLFVLMRDFRFLVAG